MLAGSRGIVVVFVVVFVERFGVEWIIGIVGIRFVGLIGVGTLRVVGIRFVCLVSVV